MPTKRGIFAKVYAVLRVISIIGYLSIVLQGMFIGVPWGLVLLLGVFEGELLSRICILFADAALIGLFILSAGKRTKETFGIEAIAYFFLLALLVERLTSVPIRLFNYACFIVPALCFAVLYPLSLLFLYKIFRTEDRVAT